jgi:transcriptional regulator with XRE-family HTH domain
MDIGKRIKKRRHELSLTQHDIAQKLGLTAQHISAIEQEKRLPSIALLEKIARELGVTIDYLVTGKDSPFTELIPSIKADRKLTLKTKKALISLVEEFYK